MNTPFRRTRTATALALLSATCLGPPAAFATEQTDRATAFRAADGRIPGEEVPGGLLMVAAYAAIWLLVFAFVWRMARRQAALERMAEELAQRLRDAEASSHRTE